MVKTTGGATPKASKAKVTRSPGTPRGKGKAKALSNEELEQMMEGPGREREELEDPSEEGPSHRSKARILNSLEQVRAQAESVYEPFVLQKGNMVYFLLWKCKGMRVAATAFEEGLDFEIVMNPPAEELITQLGLESPAPPLKPMKSTFGVNVGVKLVPGSLKPCPTQHPDLLVMQVQKLEETKTRVVFDEN